jgi:hypothetical protein
MLARNTQRLAERRQQLSGCRERNVRVVVGRALRLRRSSAGTSEAHWAGRTSLMPHGSSRARSSGTSAAISTEHLPSRRAHALPRRPYSASGADDFRAARAYRWFRGLPRTSLQPVDDFGRALISLMGLNFTSAFETAQLSPCSGTVPCNQDVGHATTSG